MENERLIDIVRQTFDLTKTEASVVLFLSKTTEKYTIVDLMKEFVKDRTTIAKVMIKLMKKTKLIKQYQTNLHRGFRFTYKFNKDIDFKELLIKEIKKSIEKDIEVINSF
jgi:predicted transcriptional regulator